MDRCCGFCEVISYLGSYRIRRFQWGLKNLRKASTRFHSGAARQVLEKKSMLAGGFQTSALTKVSQALSSCKKSSQAKAPSESPSEPLPSPDSRSSCDGWRPKPRHGSRCGCRRTACAPTQPAHPVKLAKMARKRAQRRWRRAAHAICLAGACSCTLGNAPVG